MSLIALTGIFAISLLALLAAAAYFTSAAEKVGIYFGLPSFAVGLFIVSIGTSLPELVSSIISVNRGVSGIVAGNVIGANISNIMLTLGVVSLVARKRIELGKLYIFIDLNFFIGSAILVAIFMWDGVFTYIEGIIAIVAYIVFAVHLTKTPSTRDKEELSEQVDKNKKKLTPQLLILLITGLAIYFSADYTIYSIIEISTLLEVSPGIISITALALGTSLPELAVNVSAARKGNAALAVGNILGSCIFNSLIVLGSASMFGKIELADQIREFSLPFFVASSLLFYMLAQDKKISKYEGMLFLIFYVVFIGKIMNLF